MCQLFDIDNTDSVSTAGSAHRRQDPRFSTAESEPKSQGSHHHSKTYDKFIILHKKELMGNLTISSKILDKYFGYLKNLDKKAKERLIPKLIESIDTQSDKGIDPKSMFGAWVDSRTSDDIIADIIN